MRRLVLISYFTLSLVTVFGQINSGSPAIPFGSKIATIANPYGNGVLPTNLPTGTYNPGSNQFGKSQDAADAYTTWKTNYVEACGSNFRVKFDSPSQTVSEGIGYGMLIAAYAGDKALFDGLWGYYKANSNGNGVMNWRTGACSPDQSGGATDADLDAAMALLVAKCQWPSATSPYTYSTEATNLITAIKNTEIHNTSFQAINGDGWGFGSSCRNPSYQSPAYYRQFAAQVPGQASTWNSAVTAAYTLLNANRNTTTGLVSNWSDPSGAPNGCNGSNEYGYDACRNPWRMATDVLWYGNTVAQTNFCVPIAAYVNGKGANASGPVAQAGGTATTNEATFTSMFAAGICGSNTTYQTIMNSIYTKTVGTTDALPRYFGNTLRVISLFMQTGNFWQPCNPAPLTISVALTAPTNNQSFNEGDVITLTATASTTSGSISKIEFYNGTTLIGTATSSPYTITWSNAPAGTNQLIAKAYNSNSESATTLPVPVFVIKSINQTPTAPLIDGTGWGGTTAASLNTLIGGTVTDASDLSANYKAMWDATNFYLLVNVTDNVKTNNAGTDYYNDDAVEVFFDIGNDKATSYGTNDFQYTFRWNDNTVYEKNSKTTGVTFSRVDNTTGYVMQMTFPWTTLKGTPAINQLVGFDVEVDDDDDGGGRDGKISWAASADQAWTDPSYMGTVILKGIACAAPGTAGTITGASTTCAGTTGVTYSIATVSGATGYTWTVPTGATITAGTNTNAITVTFGSTGGNVTVTPTNTCGSGTSSSATVAVTAAVAPAVTIASNPSGSICSGTSVTFTATAANGGTPTYQWRNNGAAISGATASTYSSTTLANGDQIDVVMTSTATCRSANTATSSPITMAVTTSVTPAVTIASNPSGSICSGTSVTFTATAANGGTPTYQWRNNGTTISGATASTYTSATLANNDQIDVVMTSTATCRSANAATSAPVAMTVTTSVVPGVTIATPATAICTGANTTFTATPSNGGTPTYQWRNNGATISGATGATYSSATLVNGDQIDVIMTSTANCRTTNTATSAPVTMSVTTSVVPGVTIATPTTAICSGASTTFTATPVNGGTPTYQWRNNGANITGATAVTYTSTTLADGNKIDVIMTSTNTCRTANTATSSQITMSVTSNVTPAVSITSNQTGSICAGTSTTFTAAPVNGGTPSYQWRNNGTNISGATGVTYTSTTLANGNKIDVVMTSTAACRTANTATSTQITMAVTAGVTPAVSIVSTPTGSICAGTSVAFTASPVSGGTPTYQWRNNGSDITGATAGTYTSTTLANADKIDVVMTSTATCRTANTAASTQVTMAVNANVAPAVTISASTPTTICTGTSVTFTATPTNGGTPGYQWRKNSTNISGATTAVYTTATIANGDKFDVVMTSTATCRSANTATSAQITMTISASVTAAVTVSVAPSTTIYAGQMTTFTATPVNGGTPAYQWKNNGNTISGATNATYQTNELANGTSITVTMVSNIGCVSNPSVSSNTIVVTVNANPTFDASISGPATVSSNQPNVTYSVPNSNGMQYQWSVPAGATIISGQGTNTIVVNFGSSSGEVTVVETNPIGQTATVTIPVTVQTATAIALPNAEAGILVYPVPCAEQITIDMVRTTEESVAYTLIDATGNTIKTGAFVYKGKAVQIETDFAAGVYVLMLQWDGKSVIRRITKL